MDIILQSIGRDSSKDISFTVARSDAEEAKAILEDVYKRQPWRRS